MVRIDLVGWPQTLADLEALCALARERHLPDDAAIGSSGGQIVIQESAK